MDQSPLVAEQIEAGGRLAGEFARFKPLQAAFWLNEGEDGQWFLYLASDQIDDTNFDVAYSEVIRILGPGPHTWLDPFQVKVTGVDDAVVRAVIDLQHSQGRDRPIRLRTRRLGGIYVAEIYIYPLPIPLPT